jgi:hypothetical protein
VAAFGQQGDQRAQDGGAGGGEQRQEQRVPGHAAAHAADHATQAPDAVLAQPFGQRGQREGPALVDKGADQALAHRQRHEQQQQRRAEDHRAGDEEVTAEVAQPRDARAQQHQQRQQQQRATEADAELPAGQLTEPGVERLERPAGGADGKTAGQQPGERAASAQHPAPALRAPGGQPPGRAAQRQPGQADPQPGPAMLQRLHQRAGRLGAAEDTRQRAPQ